MSVYDAAEIAQRLARLRVEHRDLDQAIILLGARCRDELELSRLKKRKLLLKDTIARLESLQIPDLDA